MPAPRSTDDTASAPPVDLSSLERIPPHNLPAEQAVLGGMMLSPNAVADVVEILRPQDHYRPAHETIHAAILDLFSQSEPADPITVAAELSKRGDLVRVGGQAYLMELVQAIPTAANAAYYAEIVHECAVLRRLAAAGTRITQLATTAEGELSEIRNKAEKEVHEAVAAGDTGVKYLFTREALGDFWDTMDARANNSGKLTGIPTGLTDLDSLTNGLQPGQMVVVAARPSMGKSTLALDFARAASCQHGLKSVFFSLEMARQEIMERLYSAEAQVGLHHIRCGTLTDDDLTRMAAKTDRISSAPLLIDDSADLTLTEVRSRARRIQQQHGLDLVVVDYLQLMQSGGSRRAESRQQEVSDMSRSMKLLAKELDVPVIVLSQLNRGPEQRTDKKPVVSDLRDSGAVEQDADLVILLHREDAYEKDSPRSGEADLIVGKHRNGPTATITVAFQGHYSRFVDMART